MRQCASIALSHTALSSYILFDCRESFNQALYDHNKLMEKGQFVTSMTTVEEAQGGTSSPWARWFESRSQHEIERLVYRLINDGCYTFISQVEDA